MKSWKPLAGLVGVAAIGAALLAGSLRRFHRA